MENTRKFLDGVFSSVEDIARQTVDYFGEERANQFRQASDDGLVIACEIQGQYAQDQLLNLVNVQLWGMLKEFKWLQVLFLAGNYPIVKSRLRYLWEGMYRAYFVETHEDDAVRCLAPDQKLQWIEEQKLNWPKCVEPALLKLMPLAQTEPDVRRHYKGLWDELNRYAHPSQYVLSRMVDDSSLLVADNFDAAWADDTLRASLQVVDLIWLAVLTHNHRAIPAVAHEGLGLEYNLTGLLLKQGCRFG